MSRHLDLTALRSFVAVAETGGVTRAAGAVNRTQSAVSMQIRRLEEALDVALFDRKGRGVSLTLPGEQLLGYARRLLRINDEAWARLTAEDYVGEVVLGVPHDIIYPNVPKVLKRFSTEFPRMKMRLISAPTRRLLEMFGRGECDAILTTEDETGPDGECLVELPLVWMGATGTNIWRERPLPVASCSQCNFRPGILAALDAAEIPWKMVVDSDMDNAVEAAVTADLAVHASIPWHKLPQTEEIDHGGALPELGTTRIILYRRKAGEPVSDGLADILRQSFSGPVRAGAGLALAG